MEKKDFKVHYCAQCRMTTQHTLTLVCKRCGTTKEHKDRPNGT